MSTPVAHRKSLAQFNADIFWRRFGESLRVHRAAAGVEPHEVADASEVVTTARVNACEADGAPLGELDLEGLARVADLLDVDPADLLAGVPAKAPT